MQKITLHIAKALISCGFIIFLLSSCKKFLDEKQDNKFTVPQSLADLQMLLDHYTVMNTNYAYQAEVAADNYYLASADFNSLTDNSQKNFHSWQKDDQRSTDWAFVYRIILAANTVLDNADQLIQGPGDIETAKKIKAAAYFFRANTFYNLAQVYATPYDATDAAYGIPLRLSSDINIATTRSTVHETYRQVINDLKMAAAGIDSLQVYPNRPTKTAAFAALARCYLAMSDYTKAGAYADSALQLKYDLINFNSLSATAANPFTRFNKEVIFPVISSTSTCLAPARAIVDTTLFRSYHINDLRRTLFFKQNTNGTYAFKGDYNGANNGAVFLGFTVDELYLIKAECQARQGQWQEGMQTLNALLQTRWRTNMFVALNASGPAQALTTILQERRKELCFRGQRWTDLRRLNKDAGTQTTIYRFLNNTIYSLAPNAAAYTFQIPARIIEASGIQQNP